MIFSNPVMNILHLLPSSSGDFEVEIFSQEGRIVLKSHNASQLNIDGLMKGLFLVKISQNVKTFNGRFIKL
jgi:hypothetical protein